MTENLTVKGLDTLKVKLKSYERRANDLTPCMKKIGTYLAEVNRRVFATNGAYNGKPWRALNPDYHLWKIRNRFPTGILVRTGALRASYTGRPMGVEVYGKATAIFGSNIRYATYHQTGTRKMPARQVIVVTKKMRLDIKQIVESHMRGTRISAKDLV